MSDYRVLETEKDMIEFLETPTDTVSVSKNLSATERVNLIKSKNITPINLYDSNESVVSTLYVRPSYKTGATGGAMMGVKLNQVTETDDDYDVDETEYGVLTYGKDRYDAKQHAKAILKSIGIDIDENNPSADEFLYNYSVMVMNDLRHTSNGDIPIYYKKTPTGIHYYLGDGDYKKAVEWLIQLGSIPASVNEFIDLYDTSKRELQVRVDTNISYRDMALTVINKWLLHNNFDYHSKPSTEAMLNGFMNMYNNIMEDWGTSNCPLEQRDGTFETGTKPNAFVLSISGAKTSNSIGLRATFLRIGTGYHNPYIVVNQTGKTGINRYAFTDISVGMTSEPLDYCRRTVDMAWRFSDNDGWAFGKIYNMTDPSFVDYKPIYGISNLTTGFKLYALNGKDLDQVSSLYTQTEVDSFTGNLGNVKFGNINSRLQRSHFNDYNGVLSLNDDFKDRFEDESANDYVDRTTDTDENPNINIDTGEPFNTPLVPIRIPTINPIYIPADGIEDIIKDVIEKENPTPTPTPPIIDDGGDEGDTPLPPSIISEGGNGIFSVYNPTSGEVKAFGDELWSNSVVEILKTIWQNPMEGILSLQLIYCTPQTGATKLIGCGHWKSNVSSKIVTNQFVEIDCGGINLFEHYGDARDYAPYTDITLFLPFIGFVDLDIYEVMGGVIQVKYVIDVLTGTCLASVIGKRDDSEKVLYTFNGNCSVQLPLTSADKSAIITGVVSGAVSGGKTGGSIGGIAGAFEGNPLVGQAIGTAVGGALGGAWGGFTGGVSIHRSGEMGANVGALGIKKPYMLVKRYKTFSASGYGGLMGYADNYRCRVGDVSGFCVFSNPIVNIKATDEELIEISSLLTTGIYV